jgi:hypothetical protein
LEVSPDLEDTVIDDMVPSMTDTREYLDLRITDSDNSNGDYTLARNGYLGPAEFSIEGLVPNHRAAGGLPQFFTLAIGLKRVDFSSTDTTLATKIQVFDEPQAPPPPSGPPNYTGHELFFSFYPIEGVGTSKYFAIPENPGSLSVGDLLELYESVPTIPSRVFDVTGLSNLIIEIDPEIETDFGSIPMGGTVPFARIRLVRKSNYTVMEEELVEWLARYENQDAWFTELYRLLNPLLVNKNPTLSAVSSAKTHLEGMVTNLNDLEAILAGYETTGEETVDTLINTYEERGSERGIDLLLQGRFRVFFNLTHEGMSYAGHLREQLKLVSREDVPIRKVGRLLDPDISQIDAEWEDPDYEEVFTDIEGDDEENIEVPGNWVEVVG